MKSDILILGEQESQGATGTSILRLQRDDTHPAFRYLTVIESPYVLSAPQARRLACALLRWAKNR